MILGEGLYGGGVIARHAAITAGLTTVPGLAMNRHCAAGLAAVQGAAASIRAGMDELIIAGRRELRVHRRRGASSGSARSGSTGCRRPTLTAPTRPTCDMSITVGWNAAVRRASAARRWTPGRCARTATPSRAIDEGRFKDEIVPIETPHGLFAVDEHPRRDTSMEKLASLKPLHPEIEGFSITAGQRLRRQRRRGRPGRRQRPAAAAARAWPPSGPGRRSASTRPRPGWPRSRRSRRPWPAPGCQLAEVDLFEINEAFAAMCVATIRLLDLDPERVNVNGSGCSLGHPVAATGARMLVTLVHELRRRGGGIGVAAMCAGGGMGSAAVIEVPAP